MTQRARLLSALAALVLLLAACSGGGEAVDVEGAETAADTGTEGTEPATGGTSGAEGGTLVAAISGQPDQLDPHQTTSYPSFQVLENVYDTLVVPAADLESFEPALATEWTESEDGLTWTFQLRDGVTFHDGSSFEAQDVVASYTRIIDQELANAFRFATVEEVAAPDETTVELRLSEPTPNLLANIGGFKGMSIIPSEAVEGADLNANPVGTGPFRFDSQGPGGITLTAYPGYWGEGPFVDGVEFRFIAEATTALTELQTGEVDWTDNVPPQQVSSLQDGGDVTLETTPSVDYWYLSMNYDVEPFDQVPVRQAVSYAVDREAVNEAATFGTGTVNQTAIPETSFWSSDYAPYSYDPDRARQLLEEAGVSDLSMGLMVTDEFPQTVQAAQVIAANLGEVGIDVEIQSEEFSVWLDRQSQGDFDAFMLGWLGNLDPFGFYHSQHVCDGSNNYQNYCDEETTELLQQAANEVDRETRRDLYSQAVERIVDDVSYAYFYNPEVVQAWVPGLSGYEIRPDKAINFETVRLGG